MHRTAISLEERLSLARLLGQVDEEELRLGS